MRPFPNDQYPICSTLDEGNHDMVNKNVNVECGEGMDGEHMLIKTSEDHCIRKHHEVALDHTSHSIGDVIGEVEPPLVSETIKHLHETMFRGLSLKMASRTIAGSSKGVQ
ncbi:hypothetical protein Tco_0690094 [Tanacetum coccineum]